MNYIFALVLILALLVLFKGSEKYRGTYEGSLDSVYDDVHPKNRKTDFFRRCSPQSTETCQDITWP